jgi:hypothetical protein
MTESRDWSVWMVATEFVNNPRTLLLHALTRIGRSEVMNVLAHWFLDYIAGGKPTEIKSAQRQPCFTHSFPSEPGSQRNPTTP